MSIKEYLALRKARKHLKDLRAHARGLYNLRRDIMPPAVAASMKDALDQAAGCLRGTQSEVADAVGAIESALSDWSPLHRSGWTENFEVLLVALGVAMAFRCYFFQPFKIPTGSMQPTLYGIHSEEREAPTLFDKMPLKPLKWLITGDWYREVRIGPGGQVQPIYNDDRKPGYAALQVAGKRYYVPSDVFARQALRVGREGHVEPGSVLWSGIVHAGDHVFVNRILWNFRRPHRGEVMVFSTLDITGLPPGTHYIKRMTGLPDETLAIRPPELLIDGEPVTEPFTIGRIVRREKLAAWAPPYAGYQVIGNKVQGVHFEPAPHLSGDTVTLGANKYYAMGDNTGNSYDSRYWGPVPERNLLGPACLVYWPFTSPRLGLIH